jgi:hypothetical protein
MVTNEAVGSRRPLGLRSESGGTCRAGNIGSAKIGSAGNRPSNQKQASLFRGPARPGDRRKLRASRYASHSISKAALSTTMVMLPRGYKSPLPLCRTATPS